METSAWRPVPLPECLKGEQGSPYNQSETLLFQLCPLAVIFPTIHLSNDHLVCPGGCFYAARSHLHLRLNKPSFPSSLGMLRVEARRGSRKAAVGPYYRAYSAIRASARCDLKLETGSSAKLVPWYDHTSLTNKQLLEAELHSRIPTLKQPLVGS